MDATSRRQAVPHYPADNLEGRSDDDLMSFTRHGVQRAFDVLVVRHQARALRIASRYLGDAASACDVAQNAFLEVYRGMHRYQAQDRFTAYFSRIVLNQCRMNARSRSAAQRLVRRAPARAHVSAESVMVNVHRHDLQYALSRLSEKLRVVVVLRYGGDLDLAEIADTLELPIGTVKRRLFVAMEKLRNAMEGGS